MAPGSSSTGQLSEGRSILADDFTTQLRKRTEGEHLVSSALIKLSAPVALSSTKTYGQLLVSFYYVFQAMEQELETRRLQYPKISPIYFRELFRTRMFERDLEYYFPSGEIPSPSEATREYVDELRSSVEDDPVLLIAYSQAMYLALIKDGPVIRRWVANAFGLTPPLGCAIFDFSETISDVSKFRNRFNDAVNSIALSDPQKERIIRQEQRVFERNNSIIKEVCSSVQLQQRLRAILLRVIVVVVIFGVLFYLLFYTSSTT